ncbi:MAG: acyl-CoA dehydrogenase family protein [Gemmatimonadota bacterium]
MDFSWTDEQLALRQEAVAFAESQLNEPVWERPGSDESLRSRWEKCAAFGVQGLSLPNQYGGMELDALTTALIMEGLGYGCSDNGLLFAINAQMWSVQMPILTFGTPEQKSEWLPRFARGESIGAHGMTEPGSGSDAFSLTTRAQRRQGGYLLNGAKTFVTNAPVADVALVFAKVDSGAGMAGITAFLVPTDVEGLTVGRPIEKMGLNTARMGELAFDDCFVPERHRLGPEGNGAAIFHSSMEWERACLLACQVGRMERQLETCISYARDREQFGQAIGKFQSVSNRIADMKVRLEASRLMVYRVAWMKTMNRSAALESAMVKLFLSEAFLRSSEDAIRIHGGYGYTTEGEVEQDARDAFGGILYSGTSDLQRVVISRLLGL